MFVWSDGARAIEDQGCPEPVDGMVATMRAPPAARYSVKKSARSLSGGQANTVIVAAAGGRALSE